jgi:serine/threonine-protein kinase RsbW
MASHQPQTIRQTLPVGVDAPLAARSALAGLAAQIGEDVLERSQLVITELVTNSVKHALLQPSQQIDVRIVLIGDRLLTEVVDAGSGFDPAVASAPDAVGGWGLSIVRQLTDRWGVDLAGSTRVWCEFDLERAQPAGQVASR